MNILGCENNQVILVEGSLEACYCGGFSPDFFFKNDDFCVLYAQIIMLALRGPMAYFYPLLMWTPS